MNTNNLTMLCIFVFLIAQVFINYYNGKMWSSQTKLNKSVMDLFKSLVEAAESVGKKKGKRGRPRKKK